MCPGLYDSFRRFPSLGLVALTLAAILWNLFALVFNFSPFGKSEASPDRTECIYQISQNGVCDRTLFVDSALPLRTFLKKKEKIQERLVPRETALIPCDTLIDLLNAPPYITLNPVPGRLLIIAGGRIDLNRANQTDLLAAPGIGTRISETIIRYREIHGPFSSVDDLLKLPGIGERKLQVLRHYLTVKSMNPGQPVSECPCPVASP